MNHYTVLLDANVLYPAPLRDALMQLAVTDLFKAKWTNDIHREWIDALLRNDPRPRSWSRFPTLSDAGLLETGALSSASTRALLRS